MRTTVEIRDDQHRALSAVAQQRGLRGFSRLMEEAVDAYLSDLDSRETDLLLGLQGVLDDAQEREVRARIADMRAVWRAS